MDKLQQVREYIERLATLNTDELAELRSLIVEAGDEIDALPDSEETIAALMELADAGEQVMGRQAEIEEQAAVAAQNKAAARDRIAKIKAKAEGDEDAEAGESTDPSDVQDAEKADADAEAVAASSRGARISDMARRRTPVTPSPEHAPASPHRASLVATAGLNGYRPGDVLLDRDALAIAMSRTLDRMSPRDRARGDVVVASAEWAYPEERQLTDDADLNARRLDAVTHPQSLVATGGICSPVNVDWSLDTWAVADRPLRDGFAAFQATRGGLTYRPPINFSALSGATSVWTAATDANPAGATKPVVAISCPTPVTVFTSAIPTRLGFGNMQARFDPETVAMNTDLAIAAAARVAELNLLNTLQTFATQVTEAQQFGASRDFFSTLDRVTAAYRFSNRLSENQVLTAVLPRWIRDVIRADRVRETAHDAAGAIDPFGISDEQIDAWFAVRRVKAIFTLDALGSGSGYPTQNFGAFTASSAIPSFPASVVWNLYIEGSIQFLDGGRLDLGVVRDSTLDSTNDYETFVETFEGLANRGFSGQVLQIVSSICANGGSSGTVAPGSLCN